jgi:hypothetical protein
VSEVKISTAFLFAYRQIAGGGSPKRRNTVFVINKF